MPRKDAHPSLSGMTVNERLTELGLTAAFDAAIARRDKSAAVEVLQKAQFSPQQAHQTVDLILADPKHYGF